MNEEELINYDYTYTPEKESTEPTSKLSTSDRWARGLGDLSNLSGGLSVLAGLLSVRYPGIRKFRTATKWLATGSLGLDAGKEAALYTGDRQDLPTTAVQIGKDALFGSLMHVNFANIPVIGKIPRWLNKVKSSKLTTQAVNNADEAALQNQISEVESQVKAATDETIKQKLIENLKTLKTKYAEIKSSGKNLIKAIPSKTAKGLAYTPVTGFSLGYAVPAMLDQDVDENTPYPYTSRIVNGYKFGFQNAIQDFQDIPNNPWAASRFTSSIVMPMVARGMKKPQSPNTNTKSNKSKGSGKTIEVIDMTKQNEAKQVETPTKEPKYFEGKYRWSRQEEPVSGNFQHQVKDHYINGPRVTVKPQKASSQKVSSTEIAVTKKPNTQETSQTLHFPFRNLEDKSSLIQNNYPTLGYQQELSSGYIELPGHIAGPNFIIIRQRQGGKLNTLKILRNG